MELNQYIDHTLLRATATQDDIAALCEEAREYKFYAVCINGCYIPLAKKELKGTEVKIVSVVGFPLGASAPESKVREAILSIALGADEIDMVMNIGFFKSGWYQAVAKEIEEVKKAIGNSVLKVIIETGHLTNEEIKTACQLVKKAGADYVKTSTGFGTGGATVEAVKLMLQEAGTSLKIKASGGIKTAVAARDFLKLGVSRIGTSSGVEIISGTNNKNGNEHILKP